MRKNSYLLLGIIILFAIFFVGCKNYNINKIENTTPVKIGISWERDFPDGKISEDVQMYVNSIKKVGAKPILLTQIKNEKDAVKILKTVDAIILTGGEDINPTYYNEKPHKKAEAFKSDRDISDSLLLKAAIAQDYPVLGTCRGMQMLNVILDGTLYQDLPTEYLSDVIHRDPNKENFVYHECSLINKDSHLYQILKTDKLTVNSWHHQAIKKLGKGLKITALAPDGVVEAIELEHSTFIIGVQFHPEWHVARDDNKQFIPIFEALRDYGLKKKKINNEKS